MILSGQDVILYCITYVRKTVSCIYRLCFNAKIVGHLTG